MKRTVLLCAVLGALVLWGRVPHRGTDVARLHPVEVVAVTAGDGMRLQTDTGLAGEGSTPEAALEDLRSSATGTVFLDTADYLLLSPEAERYLPLLLPLLRPTCRVCLYRGEPALAQAARYLAGRDWPLTLGVWRAEGGMLPVLITEEGRMELVYP